MTNEEARLNLEKLLQIYDDGMIDFSIIRESIKVAIEALKAQDVPDTNVGDLISRREAIELANSLKDDLPDDERIADTVMAHNEGILEYQTKLSLLPSAQPEPHWIPVSERLPDVDEDGYSDLVLVSFSNFSVPAILEYRKGDDD